MKPQKAHRNRKSERRRRAPRLHGKKVRCPIQKKVRYASKADAVTALATASQYFAVTRPYQCPHCGDWHLSSKA